MSSLRAATSGFVLSAAITVVVNTALACAKDASLPLKQFMRSLAGNDWITQGLADFFLFVIVGLVLIKTGAAEKMNPDRLIGFFVAAVVIGGTGLAVWYALF